MNHHPVAARGLVALGIGVLALQLAGCAGMVASSAEAGAGRSSDSASPPPIVDPVIAFAERQRQAADEAERAGRWADAARGWEVVTLVSPQDTDALARRASLLARIDDAVSDRLRRAADARRHGDLDGAQRLGLQALALRPDDEPAMALVRTLEAERNRRVALARRALPAPPATPGALAGAPSGGGHAEESPVRGRVASPAWARHPAR